MQPEYMIITQDQGYDYMSESCLDGLLNLNDRLQNPMLLEMMLDSDENKTVADYKKEGTLPPIYSIVADFKTKYVWASQYNKWRHLTTYLLRMNQKNETHSVGWKPESQ